MILLVALLLPAVAAVILPLVPRDQARSLAIVAAVLELALSMVVLQTAATGTTLQLTQAWAPEAGLNLRLAADGVSASLLALSALVGLLALLATRIERINRPRVFVALLLLIETGTAGVVLARDLVLFYVFWEAVLVPFFILIAMYGEGRRQYAAIKLMIYTGAGSLAMLVAILVIFTAHGAGTTSFALDQLAQTPLTNNSLVLGLGAADLAFLGFALAFAIKTPLFPLHGWLADAYTSAPTPVVMVLAGVVSKLGPYGFYRVAIPLLPASAQRFGPLLMTLAAVGIVYGALLALRQEDAKRMVSYLSLSHMCFITLGIVGLTSAGIAGGLLQMINHGILISALFFIVGHFEARLGTRSLSAISGLARRAPALTAVFLVVALATLGLPGLNGFVGEYLIMLGTYTRSWWLLLVAATGVVLAAWYTLRFFQGTMAGPPSADDTGEVAAAELSANDIWVLLPLASLAVLIGVYPAPLVSAINASVGAIAGALGAGA
ncbi:MAG TPA: NADH-quinone oxidoreductase subunit M [Candidatus Dormibacteraeota bacterium]|nr:NADH-quinone oxidoreductase subunit M [Candidatus Dormibacteraeota bacterium]